MLRFIAFSSSAKAWNGQARLTDLNGCLSDTTWKLPSLFFGNVKLFPFPSLCTLDQCGGAIFLLKLPCIMCHYHGDIGSHREQEFVMKNSLEFFEHSFVPVELTSDDKCSPVSPWYYLTLSLISQLSSVKPYPGHNGATWNIFPVLLDLSKVDPVMSSPVYKDLNWRDQKGFSVAQEESGTAKSLHVQVHSL